MRVRARRGALAFGVATAAVALAGLACTPQLMTPGTEIRIAQRAAVTAHVVIVSIDGLRADAVTPGMTPTLWRLARSGSYSLTARTISPSKTLPSHTSMLTGVTPSVHGITWNTDETDERGTVRVPTVFGIADGHGMATAAFFGKTKFNHLDVPGTIDHEARADEDSTSWKSDRTVAALEEYLAGDKPNLMFVHFADPDYAGHTWGWMTPAYRTAVWRADAAVERLTHLLDRALGAGEYALIITADHGGHGRSHGSSDPRDMTIPWIAWGEGVREGTHLAGGIRTMDTAATALWALGLAVPTGWSGAPVAGAFDPVRVAPVGY